MPFARWTWVGLAFVVAGWISIFSAALFGAPTGGFLSGYGDTGSSQLLSIAGQTAVFTGLGLMLLGVLFRGVQAVETLSEEFAFVRTQQADDPADEASPQVVAAPKVVPAPVPAPAPVPQTAPEIVSRGEISGREYVLFADGTVGVETLLGRRRFRTLGDAREFIGA